MGLLPTTKSVKRTDDPRNLIIYSTPKAGKTSALAQLDNCLIIDLENGSDYVSGYIVKANNWQDLQKIAKELVTAEHNFKFVALDTVTALEEISLNLACLLYQRTPKTYMGRLNVSLNVKLC